ncbi:nucleoside-diphosphate sugar epimerase [Nocardioides baekrokdamisoli]|uniref:Nucleoside-diphosphate sugar epimerase n=1 Tax=Nocardioides baekrokdamisoli TaxID=1804624 RepID=A0A3G9ITQ5_9ACTN|nr:NAD-dependent epimerase/dehydratase family protein [Nocardioides baekrokdamisoli]BBH17011.1 nucleoside-diphosphate sugar epimerase [Nocardioides baekrokdamisoli]
MTKIAVAGGTGMVGARLVGALEARGHDVVTLSRAAGVDLVSGAGLAPAIAGVDVIVDVTSTVSTKAHDCAEFFGAVARNLQREGAAAGVQSIVTLSIVGIDHLTGGGVYGHYVGKLMQEKETKAGSVPAVILRATQFHEFAGQLIDWTAKGPFMPCPRQPSQTVALDTVVEHLVRLGELRTSAGTVTFNLAGPQKALMADLVRATARTRGRKLVVIPVWLPGETPRRVRQGALQAPTDATIDGPTFDEWLERESALPE